MNRLVIGMALLLLAGPSFAGGADKFKAEEFGDKAKAAKKYVGANAKKIGDLKGKKLIVVECVGEFMQERKTIDAGWTTSTSTISLNDEYYVRTTDRVFDIVSKVFEDNGITVAAKEELLNNPTYQELDLKSEKGTKGYKGGIGKQGKETKGVKVSTTGLGVFTTFGMFGVLKRLPSILHETGADGSIRIAYYVDKGKNGAPVLTKFSVTYDGDLLEQKAGFKGREKTTYYTKTQNANLFSLKKGLASQVEVRGEERGSINMEAYDASLMEMIQTVAGMFNASLQSGKK